MSDFYIGASSNTIDFDDVFEPYSRVKLYKSDGTLFTAGNDSGRTLTITSPYATQEMCNDMLGQVNQMSYQPFETSGTVYDPAMDLGDSLTVYGKYSTAYSLIENYGSLITANISAPNGEQIDHEIPYQSPMARAIGYLERAQEATDKKILEDYNELIAAITVQDGALQDVVAGLQNYVRYDLENGSAFAGSKLATKIGEQAQAAIEAYVVTDDKGNSESLSQMLSTLITLEGEVDAGTKNYVRYDLSNNTSYASSQLFAKIGETSEAKVEAYVNKELGSLVRIKADLVDIAAKKATIDALTFLNGSLNVSGNIRSSANGSIEALTGTIIGKTVAASDSFTLKGEEYTAQEITSTNGTKYNVLGCIRGAS